MFPPRRDPSKKEAPRSVETGLQSMVRCKARRIGEMRIPLQQGNAVRGVAIASTPCRRLSSLTRRDTRCHTQSAHHYEGRRLKMPTIWSKDVHRMRRAAEPRCAWGVSPAARQAIASCGLNNVPSGSGFHVVRGGTQSTKRAPGAEPGAMSKGARAMNPCNGY